MPLPPKLRTRGRKRTLVPVMLALAILFAAAMSVGYSAWSSTLTITSTVQTKFTPMQITEVGRYNEKYSGMANTRLSLSPGTAQENWVVKAYCSSSSDRVIIGEVLMNSTRNSNYSYSVSIPNSKLRFLKLGTLDSSKTTSLDAKPSTNQGREYSRRTGLSAWAVWDNMRYNVYGDTRSGTDAARTVLEDNATYRMSSLATISTDVNMTFVGCKLPVQVKLSTNSNSGSIVLSGFSFSGSGSFSVYTSDNYASGAAIGSGSVSVASGDSVTLVILPSRTNGAYGSGTLTFKDQENTSYSVAVNIG